MANDRLHDPLTAKVAEKQNDVVLVECATSIETSPFCLLKRDSNVAMPYPVSYQPSLCLLLQNVSSPTRYALSMEGPPMTFVFYHGGLFKTGEDGDMVYEPDNTEVLMGVEGDTLDVFFVRGYYKELGYIEAGNYWWKVPGVLIASGLKKLVTDADLIAMCKDCRRNQYLINLYFEDCISQPCVVDNIREGVALLEAGSSKKKFSSQAKMHHSQPVKTPTVKHLQPKKPTSQPTKAASQSSKPKSQPSKPNSQPTKPASQPNKPNKSYSQPTKPTHQASKTTSQPIKTPLQVTRSGRCVRECPIQEEDSDSHDSYESTEDELYKPPKILGDNLYSSDSGKGSPRKQKKAEAREKHRPPKSILGDKEIDSNDSSYEGFEDEESSESSKLRGVLVVLLF
ncbi:hypothetical protein Ahy_B06g085259 [Arachis hypogaea]|uniref:PB1-like domain-containing protein n=1 Tax=Arachis hypogaea TaxID=3818 RepID=A0A444YU06_ARAHY|nr:hypothetical protein Ahy_B06g085259 [Arachis hypogaea]